MKSASRPLWTLWIGLVVAGFLALPAAAQHSYTGFIGGGFGDGGDTVPTTGAGTTFVADPGQNGLPPCLIGTINRAALPLPTKLAPATTAIIPVGGTFADPGTTGAPQPIAITLNNAGVPGGGGQKIIYQKTTCTLAIPPTFLPSFLIQRTQRGGADWPNAAGTLSVGGGPGNLSVLGPNGLSSQFMTVMAGGNTFGGSVPRTGGGDVVLGIVTPGLGANVGSLPTGPQPLGGSGTGMVTGTVQNPGTFMNALMGTTNTVTLSFKHLPWTTGTVLAFDTGGNFFTSRTTMGFDARGTGPGTAGKGNIQLVSPFVATIQGPAIAAAPLIFSGIGRLNLVVPEPGSIAMLSIGLAGLVGAHVIRRRRS